MTTSIEEPKSPDWRRTLWEGHEKPLISVIRLCWAIVRFLIASWLWETGVRLAHFQPPIKAAAVILALLGLCLFGWAVWDMAQCLLDLGIKRVVLAVLVVYLGLVAINVLTVPDERAVGKRIIVQFGATAGQIGSNIGNWLHTARRAPDDFLAAYTGERGRVPMPPGFPTPDPDATPVRAYGVSGASLVSIPTPLPEQTIAPIPTNALGETGDSGEPLIIGLYAQVANTGGQVLQARDEPGVENDIVAQFPEGTRLLVLAGPETADDLTWWKVRSDTGEEGWCAGQWLTPTE